LITFDHVTKRYPGGTVAVDALDLEIPAGQTVVLVGPSGCGKTTSLRMINRLIEPSNGHIYLDGKDIQKSNPATLRRGIGYVIQQTGLFPHRTIEDNIATVPLLEGWRRAKARGRARELMQLVGLDEAMARRYPHQLSGGQQQRVGVARALAADPPVLLMDEPFSAVDPIVRASLQDELIRLQAELHKTIVLVTHDVEEAIKVGDLVAVFRPGGLLAQLDTPERLLGQPADSYVEDFVGFDRGIRRLSFFDAAGLDLTFDAIMTEDTLVPEAAAAAKRAGEPWVLVVDAQRRPQGWASADQLAAAAATARLRNVELVRYGHTFRPDANSLRAALDATVLSATGRAVGVDSSGQVVGVTSYDRLRTAIQAAQEAADLAGADRPGRSAPQPPPARADGLAT
jgi:osmoprotectant transport system ATP-binding protein